MRSIISLGICKMEIDWGKNNTFANNHSNLFQVQDFDKKIPYYYIDDNDKEMIEYKEGARKNLSKVKQRLELLGYTLKNIEKMYNDNIMEFEHYVDEKINLEFKDFFELIKNLEVSKVNNVESIIEYYDNGFDLGEYFNRCILEDEEFYSKIELILKNVKKQIFLIGEFFENLEPYIILRILAENHNNLEYDVEWRYNDVIENGWIKKEEIIGSLENKYKILIVTEGKSDSFIIQKTINNLYPDISDFFEFIDMKENYPFTGTGNLSNFCLGLSKINIQNNVIILFDNDTSGLELYNKVKDIVKPNNLYVCHLPEYEGFNEINTIGPSGKVKCNINGKAVAIECFLDFSSIDSVPIIRWNNYNKNMKQYQGELENKEEYVRKFKSANLLDGSYNCEKLKFLIEHLISMWKNR